MSVVLPAPFRPTKPKISPGTSEKLMFFEHFLLVVAFMYILHHQGRRGHGLLSSYMFIRTDQPAESFFFAAGLRAAFFRIVGRLIGRIVRVIGAS